MPNNADHLHYYVISAGKYKRKLVDKEHFMLILLSGGKVAKNATWNNTGIVRNNSEFTTSAKRFYAKLKYKVYFPYSVIDVIHARHNNINTKVRAKHHNRCLQCGPLEAYWSQEVKHEQGN